MQLGGQLSHASSRAHALKRLGRFLKLLRPVKDQECSVVDDSRELRLMSPWIWKLRELVDAASYIGEQIVFFCDIVFRGQKAKTLSIRYIMLSNSKSSMSRNHPQKQDQIRLLSISFVGFVFRCLQVEFLRPLQTQIADLLDFA